MTNRAYLWTAAIVILSALLIMFTVLQLDISETDDQINETIHHE